MIAVRVISGVLIIALAVWGFFYSFHLFPWAKDSFEWWYLPHLITSGTVAAVMAAVGGAFIGIKE